MEYIFNINYKPTVTVPQSKVGLENGTTKELVCDVDAKPDAKIQWLKDGTDIENATVKTYTVNNIDSKNPAKFTCKATNDYGSDEKVIEVKKIKAPTVTIENNNITKTEGDALTLTCTGAGDPKPTTYNWTYPDGTTATGAAITIAKLDSTHNGQFTCIASSKYGDKVFNAESPATANVIVNCEL